MELHLLARGLFLVPASHAEVEKEPRGQVCGKWVKVSKPLADVNPATAEVCWLDLPFSKEAEGARAGWKQNFVEKNDGNVLLVLLGKADNPNTS